MRLILAIGAVVLGALGALACPVAIGLTCWTAARTTDRVTLIAGRLDQALAEADERLERVEGRLAAVRTDLGEARQAAEKLAGEDAELPHVRAAIDKLFDRLLPTVERAAALADSLRTVAAGLRAAEDVVSDVGVAIEQPSRARAAADAIDRAASVLNGPQARADAAKSAVALRVKRELLEIALTAAAGSEQLAAGVADARRETTAARERLGECRAGVVFWIRAAAVAHAVVWVWLGLGQLCLIGWGRRQFRGRISGTARPA